MFESPENTVQYITWSPTGSQLVWVENNDIYLIKDLTKNLTDPASIVQITNNGEMNKIFNGVPDWVYEGLKSVFYNSFVLLIHVLSIKKKNFPHTFEYVHQFY